MNKPSGVTGHTPLDLGNLRFADAVALGQWMRSAGASFAFASDAAQAIVEHLHDRLADASTGQPATALVRCFRTVRYQSLPTELKSIIIGSIPGSRAPLPELRCLTLLGTCGIVPAWNRPRDSIAHRAIALPDAAVVADAPMISALLSQLGVVSEEFLAEPPSGFVLDAGSRSFNVFHVEDARGSEYIPAQKAFVETFGIRSVIGFGGLLPDGELFAVIFFSRVAISRHTAELFRALALSVKVALLPFLPHQLFSDDFA